MYMYIYMCIYICVYVCIHTCIHTYVYIDRYTYIYTYIHMYLSLYIYIYQYVLRSELFFANTGIISPLERPPLGAVPFLRAITVSAFEILLREYIKQHVKDITPPIGY